MSSLKIPSPHRAEVEQEFRALADRWRAETTHLSSTTKIVSHPSYRGIIEMGPTVIPLILDDLRQTRDHWSGALAAITGENPVDPATVGDVERMAEAWLEWGRREGYV